MLRATLATVDRLQPDLAAKQTLARPRLALVSLRGPNGIRLGDSREAVFPALGAGELQGRRGNVEIHNYDKLNPFAPDPHDERAFIMQVTFTGGSLTRIHIFEES